MTIVNKTTLQHKTEIAKQPVVDGHIFFKKRINSRLVDVCILLLVALTDDGISEDHIH